jgi:hypothetical protein
MEQGADDAYLVSAQRPGQVPPPYQVVRRQKIAADASAKNTEWQAKLAASPGSVWRNYKLVTSQWLRPRKLPGESIKNHPIEPPCASNPATANSTMETFQQTCTRLTTCLGCHNRARTADHIFSLWLNPAPPAGFDNRLQREEIAKQVNEILNSVKALK